MTKEELISKMQQYCDLNPIEIDFYNEDLDKKSIENILEKGKENFYSELYDWNMDYIFELEDYFRKNTLYNEFEKEISEFLLNVYTEFEIENSSLIMDFIENSGVYPIIDLQSDQLLKNTDIIAMLVFYSNYDCTNSFDTIETSDYLKEIFKVVKKGITKEDFWSVR